jgi:hypothetical protein
MLLAQDTANAVASGVSRCTRAVLSGARSYRQIHALIRARLSVLNEAFPDAALRRAPAYTSMRWTTTSLK